MLKILLLTDRMDAGGAETHLYQLASGLHDMGVDVTLLSGGGRVADALEKLGIKQIRLPLQTRDPLRLLLLRRRIFALVKKEGFTVAHAHARMPAFLMRGLSRQGVAEVVTVHARFRSGFPFSFLSHWGERTIAVSEDLRAYVSDRYGVPAERVSVIPNGIDTQRFSPPLQDLRHESNARPLRILFASRLDADCVRGAELLCRIAPTLAAKFPTLRISIAGGGSEMARLQALAAQINQDLARPIVSILGWIEDMPTCMARHDIFVGVSRAAMEAAAVGCAVVLCGNEGYLGILDAVSAPAAMQSNFCARSCPRADERALLRDLLVLLQDASLREKCAEEARSWVHTHCSADRMCRETLRLYRRICPSPVRATVTVGGYFGCGNLGDDAILLGFLEELHAISPDLQVLALSGSPHRDSRRFGIRCYDRRDPLSILYALSRADCFFCGGGSLLQNVTSRLSLTYYLSLLRLAQKKCPTVLYACGIGPLLDERAKRQTACVLEKCSHICLRDDGSLRLLLTLGIRSELLHRTADAALFLPVPSENRALSILREHRLDPTGRRMAIILRHMGRNDPLLCYLLDAVRSLCLQHELYPVFLVFDEKRDQTLTIFAARAVNGCILRLREAADATAIFRECEVVITMRLHGLILASVAGTPAMAIPTDARDEKIVSFAKSVGQTVLVPNRITVNKIRETCEYLIRERTHIRAILQASLEEERKKARKDLANIVEMIYNIRE